MSKHHDERDNLHFEQISHKGVGYEDRDLGARGILAFMVVLVVTTAVLCIAVYGYFHFAVEPGAATSQRQAATIDPMEKFPKPALQRDDVMEMNQLRIQNESVLSSYGWVDEKAGIAHIPIDDAIKAVAQQGLPVRPAPTDQPAAQFGSGANTVPGLAGGTRPETRQ